jgi:hypothetical protein
MHLSFPPPNHNQDAPQGGPPAGTSGTGDPVPLQTSSISTNEHINWPFTGGADTYVPGTGRAEWVGHQYLTACSPLRCTNNWCMLCYDMLVHSSPIVSPSWPRRRHLLLASGPIATDRTSTIIGGWLQASITTQQSTTTLHALMKLLYVGQLYVPAFLKSE